MAKRQKYGMAAVSNAASAQLDGSAPPLGDLTLLRWAGSKKRSLSVISSLFPDNYSKYIELFAGSACLFFANKAKRSCVNDNNKSVIDFYKQARAKPTDVYELFSSIERSRESYYHIRDLFKVERDPVRRSAFFYFLNRNCFNGIYRTNTAGDFNVPFSSSRVPPYPSETQFLAAAKRLKATKLVCKDFEAACRESLEPKSLVYLDPPYYVPGIRTFREYSSRPFEVGDFDRLASLLEYIHDRGSYFVMSYPKCDIVNNLNSKWARHEISVNRSIAGNPEFRTTVRELLLTNY